MAANNLRIIYQNLVDISTTTITSSGSNASTPIANLKNDSKSIVWRSDPVSTGGGANNTYNIKTNLIVSLATSTIIGGIVLPFCNLSTNATIRVRGYTGTAPTPGTAPGGNYSGSSSGWAGFTTTGTQTFDTGTNSASPYVTLGKWDWGALPLGVNSYSYGGGTYGRCWLLNKTQIAAQYLLIEIVDPTNDSNYIELSRLVVGSYWSPTYNTSFGLSTSVKDLSVHNRSESGDLITNRGISYNSMNFDLKYLNTSDRLQFSRISRGNGISKPLFISLFPDDEDIQKEQAHQIYGKLSQLSDIQHPIFEMYSSQVEIEEI